MEKNIKKLTLLHSNDLHGDFLAETIDENLIGGVSLLSGYINEVRNTEDNVLYCIAGDMFRGSIIDAEYKGMSTIEIMNLLAPNIVTVGNHEFDYGVSHLLFIEKCAKFPIINANLYITTNNARLFEPYKIFEIDGMKILFIGVITEEVLSQAKQDTLVGTFINTQEAAIAVNQICDSYRGIDIDLTVLLTHIGFEADKELASLLSKESGVDIIIGGHSHTILQEPHVENGIYIVQAGVGTNQIGRFDLNIDTDHNCINSYHWETIEINDKNCKHDEHLEQLIRHYKDITDRKYNRLITRFKCELTHPRRNTETALGNLFADIFKRSLALDIMLLASGSIRHTELGPIVQVGTLRETFPYDEEIYLFKLTGEQLRRIILFLLRDEAFLGTTEFYQFSEGIHIEYSQSEKRLITLTYNDEEVSDDQLFSIGLQHYHYSNFEKFFNLSYDEIKQNCKPRVIATSCLNILDEYLSENNLLESDVEGRITILP